MSYSIEYTRDAVHHLQKLDARHRSVVLTGIDRQLIDQPTTETRHRKRMRPNPLAPWELRLGNLRVYYDVVEEPSKTVVVLAVGMKFRNKIRVGDEEIEL